MKKTASTLLVGICALGALAFTASYADARTFHRHHHGGARIGVGIAVGAAIVASPWLYARPYPYYYGTYPYGYAPYAYGPAYYPPVVVEQPSVYVEQQPPMAVAPSGPPAAAPQAQQQYWYFCQDTQTYYPHVQSCATPWQRVMPHAPR